jgi:hypothetical protein
MSNAAPGSHEIHRARRYLSRISLAITVHDLAIK